MIRLTTTGCAMFVCLVGTISPAFQWSGLHVAQVTGKITGFESGAPGVLTAAFFATTLLFVLATSPLVPAPWWRSMTMGLMAVGVLIVLLVGGRGLWLGFPTGKQNPGGLVAYLCAFLLLVIVSLEFRALIKRHQAARSLGG